MRRWAQQYFAISKNSFVVLLGDPLMLIVQIFIIGVTLLIASLPGFSLGGQLKLVRDQAIALSFMSGCILASISAARLISEDIRKGMMPTIMSRPVAPSALLAGKWTGLVSGLCIIFISATIACLWASRLIYNDRQHMVETLGVLVYIGVVGATLLFTALRHYFRGGHYIWQANIALVVVFSLAFFILNIWGYNGADAPYGALVDWQSAFAYLYVFMALMVFSAIVSFLAVMMDVSMVLAFASVIFFGGLFSRYFINLLCPSSSIKSVINIMIPDWQLFWISDNISSTSSNFFVHFCPLLFYAICQSLLFITIAVLIFEKKEICGTTD